MKKIVMILLSVTTLAVALNFFVPVNDPVYDFLERQATRGFIMDYMNDTRPLNRNEVAGWLVKMLEFEDELHPTDRKILKSFLSEYRAEVTDEQHVLLKNNSDSRFSLYSWENFEKDMTSLVEDDIWEEQKYIYIKENEKNTIWINSDLTIRAEGKNENMRFLNQIGLEASVQLGENLAFYSNGYFYDQLINRNWIQPSKEFQGYPYNEGEYFNTLFNSKSYANLNGNFGNLALSYYPIVWGNAQNSILLSEVAPPFSSITYSKNFKSVKYNFLYGSLVSKNYQSKYMVGHHFEVHLHPRLQVSFAEMLIYGNRPAELTYVIPFQFLWPAEKILGDRDNNVMYAGLELIPLDGLRLYGNAFVDYFSFSSLGKNNWAEMYTIQTGLHLSPRIMPADIFIEFTAVRPWTYTGSDATHNYTHNGSTLGYYLGPNTKSLSARINYDISAKHRLSFSYDFNTIGSDSVLVGGEYYPSGGDANQYHSDRAFAIDNYTEWIMGDITYQNNFRLDWLYRWRNQIEFKTTCEMKINNSQPSMFYSFQINLKY